MTQNERRPGGGGIQVITATVPSVADRADIAPSRNAVPWRGLASYYRRRRISRRLDSLLAGRDPWDYSEPLSPVDWSDPDWIAWHEAVSGRRVTS